VRVLDAARVAVNSSCIRRARSPNGSPGSNRDFITTSGEPCSIALFAE
jgi:hypothetical protein